MPGNIVTINDGAEFYVGDSNMPKLIDVLNKRGIAQNRAAKSLIKEATKTSTNTGSTSALQIAFEMEALVGDGTKCEIITAPTVAKWARRLRTA